MKGSFRTVVLMGAIFLALFGEYVSAQITQVQNTNSVSGFVYNEDRAPVSSVYVELQSDFYATIGRTRTQNSGRYSFNGLAPGQYYLKVITTGTDYIEQTKSITLAAISGRAAYSEQVDFYLRSRKDRETLPTAAPGVVFLQEVPAEAQGLYEAALQDLASKNEKAAFEKLKRSLEIFPDYYAALDRLGNEYVIRGHYEAAYVLLTKALMVNKRSYSSTMGLGITLFRLKEPDLAIIQFRSAIDLEPASPNGHLWLGISLHSKKKNSEALQSLLKANELSKGAVAEIHWQLARVYKDQNEFTKAADELELYLKNEPNVKNADEVRQMIGSLRKKRP
jgi:tetratricopeptide (TPR) repeat protein